MNTIHTILTALAEAPDGVTRDMLVALGCRRGDIDQLVAETFIRAWTDRLVVGPASVTP